MIYELSRPPLGGFFIWVNKKMSFLARRGASARQGISLSAIYRRFRINKEAMLAH